MKFWSALKAVLRARNPKPAAEPTPAVDVVGARISSVLRAAGAETEQQIIAEMRKRHVAFLHANCPSTVYAFGIAGSAEHYYRSCDLIWNALMLAYPVPGLGQALSLKH